MLPGKMTYTILMGKPDCEYFCKDCLQLRLSYLDETTECSNCESKDIIKGKPGTLNKEALRKENSE